MASLRNLFIVLVVVLAGCASGVHVSPLLARGHVSLSQTVVSSTVFNEPGLVTSLAFTISSDKEAVLNSVAFVGQMKTPFYDFNTPRAFEEFSSRIRSVVIYDGDTQVGESSGAPDITGKVEVGGMTVPVSPLAPKTLTVLVQFDGKASDLEPYEALAIGIPTIWDVQLTDPNYGLTFATVDAALHDQMGANPSVVQTIKPRVCVPQLTIDQLRNASGTVAPGTPAYAVAYVDLTASHCADVDVRGMSFRIDSIGDTPGSVAAFCSGSCGASNDWNFVNVRLMDGQTALMGPAKFSSTAPSFGSFPGGAFRIPAGTTVHAYLAIDVAYPLATDVAGKRFQTWIQDVDAVGGVSEIQKYSFDRAATFSVTQ